MPSNVQALAVAALLLPIVRPRVDRRSERSRDLLLSRIRGEFNEMPCLALTAPQAVRLFGLRNDICHRVLDSLVADGILWKRDDDRFVSRAASV
jgi:hypothetical protein